MPYEPVIGMEVHVELDTASKMFCGCSAKAFGALPNTHVCPICLGMPGTLPVINEQAVRYTAMTGLALSGALADTLGYRLTFMVIAALNILAVPLLPLIFPRSTVKIVQEA